MPSPKYYAVAIGHAPGIYVDKKDLRAQISGLHELREPLWKAFPYTPRGFEDAKQFIIKNKIREGGSAAQGPHEEFEEVPLDSSEESSGESTSSSYEDDPSELMVRLETNWTKDREGKKHQWVSQGPPQFAVIFGLDSDDPRNLFGLYSLGRSGVTREKCIEQALMTFLEWIFNPQSAKFKRGPDPLAIESAEYLPPFDFDETKTILIQQPCRAVEKKYSSPPKRYHTPKGPERLIRRRIQELRHNFGIDFSIITIDPDEEKERIMEVAEESDPNGSS